MAVESTQPDPSKPKPSKPSPWGSANTLTPIEINLEIYRGLNFLQFVDQFFADLRCAKDQRFNYFNNLRRNNKATELRSWMVWLAVLAALLTSVATVIRIVSSPPIYDIYLFAGALLTYGIMGALGLYERTNDTSSSYFRFLGVTLAIRDLWTKLEFAFLKEILAVEGGNAAAQSAARDRMIALGEAFCADLDKLASDEVGEWKSEFFTSISELDTIAKEGSANTQKQLESAVKDFKTATEKAQQAAEKAEAASKPALLNVTIEGEFDDDVTVSVNNVKMISTPKKSFAIDGLLPANAKIEAVAKKGGEMVSASEWVKLEPGIQPLKLTLK